MVAAAVVVTAAALAAQPGPAQAQTQLPVNWDFASGALGSVLSPNTPPPGADNWSCKPSAEHPYPVVLVNGTFVVRDAELVPTALPGRPVRAQPR